MGTYAVHVPVAPLPKMQNDPLQISVTSSHVAPTATTCSGAHVLWAPHPYPFTHSSTCGSHACPAAMGFAQVPLVAPPSGAAGVLQYSERLQIVVWPSHVAP